MLCLCCTVRYNNATSFFSHRGRWVIGYLASLCLLLLFRLIYSAVGTETVSLELILFIDSGWIPLSVERRGKRSIEQGRGIQPFFIFSKSIKIV
jgi:hypothetical protein